MSELKETLLPQKAGDNKPAEEVTRQPQDQQNNQQQVDEDSFEPAISVTQMKESYRNLEVRCRDSAGLVFILIGVIILSTFRWINSSFMPQNTMIQITFISFLVAFLLNYYWVRIGNILPYIENEDQNFTAKLCGFSGLASIIFLLYSFQNAEVASCIFLFMLTWVVSFVTEKIYYGSGLNPKELGFVLLLTFSSYLMLTPTFLIDFDETKDQGQTLDGEGNQLSILDRANNYTNQQQKGLISALIASFCFSYLCFNIKKIKHVDVFTVTHIICLIVVLFLPIFFPIEGLHSPSLPQWVVMIIFGLVFLRILHFFVRAVQIESPAKLLGVLPVFIGISIILGTFVGNLPSFMEIAGTAITFGATFMLLKNNYQYNSAIFGDNDETKQNEQIHSNLQGSGIRGDFVELQNVNQ